MSSDPTTDSKPKPESAPPVQPAAPAAPAISTEPKPENTPPAANSSPATPAASAPSAAPNPTPPTTAAPQSEERKTWVVELPPIDNLYNFGVPGDRDRLIAQQYLFSTFLRDNIKRVMGGTNPTGILDVGCADGQVTRVFTELYPNAQVVGLDKDPNAIEAAKKNQANYSFMEKPIDFIVGEAEGPLPDGPFDLVYSSFCLVYAPNTEKALREMFRVLKPGGYVWIKDSDARWISAIENTNYTRLTILLLAAFMKVGIKAVLGMELPSLLEKVGFEKIGRVEENYDMGNSSLNSRIATSILLGGLHNAKPLILKSLGMPQAELDMMEKELISQANTARGRLTFVNIIAQKPPA